MLNQYNINERTSRFNFTPGDSQFFQGGEHNKH